MEIDTQEYNALMKYEHEPESYMRPFFEMNKIHMRGMNKTLHEVKPHSMAYLVRWCSQHMARIPERCDKFVDWLNDFDECLTQGDEYEEDDIDSFIEKSSEDSETEDEEDDDDDEYNCEELIKYAYNKFYNGQSKCAQQFYDTLYHWTLKRMV